MVSVNDVKGAADVLHEMALDVVIRGGRVLDGTGSPWRIADIGIRGGKVARVGPLGRAKSARAIDASGRMSPPVSSTFTRTAISASSSSPRRSARSAKV